MSSAAMLFACSRCFSRHPFEELSPGQQLCKECRGSFPVVKCTFCRSEFQQTSKGSTSTICKKCEQNVKLYRKPTACEYCNIIAAFIGNKCQRCTNSEKRYGAPVTCEQCKQKCAFDRKDEDKKVDGKLLCWLCTLSYKRALAKTKQTAQERREHQRITRERERDTKRREQAGRPRSHNKRPQRADVTKLPPPSSDGKDSLDGPPAKVPRPAVSRVDPHDPEHVVAMTQLKEKIVSLNKQLSQKDQQLLAKDKMITELKAKHFTVENELRNRMLSSEREFKTKSEVFSGKIKNLQKEVATLSKMKSTPKFDRKKILEIKEKERIRTVDPKQYLREKLRKAEKNDSDQKDTDTEERDEIKSRNVISDDEDDDSKDVEMKEFKAEVKVVKLEDVVSDSQPEVKKENGDCSGDIEESKKSPDLQSEKHATISESKTEKCESDKESEKESNKDSEDESIKKEHDSDKGSPKGDSDKESDDESSKKDRNSDKDSVKGDSDKESDDEGVTKNRNSDKESDDERVRKDRNSDKESDDDSSKKDRSFDKDSDKDTDKDDHDSDKDSERETDKDSDKESDKDSSSDSDA